MEHKKIVHVKATVKLRETTKPEAKSEPTQQSMFINAQYVTIYIGIETVQQNNQFEIAMENVERTLYENFGRSSIGCKADTTCILPDFRRDIVIKVSLKELPVILDEFAKKYYHFEYDIVFDYGTSADLCGDDKDQYNTIARIDRRVVGEEAFKLFAKMYIGEDVDISDIGYIQIQAPIVEYGK